MFTTAFIYTILSVKITGILCHNASSLEVLKVTGNSISIKWSEDVESDEEKPHSFQIVAQPVKSHSSLYLLNNREWTFAYTTNKAELIGLDPGTRYNISVSTLDDGKLTNPVNELIWTRIGVPGKPPVAVIVNRFGNTMEVNLKPATNVNGPITSYQLIVSRNPSLGRFRNDTLYGYEKAKEYGLSYYVTAQFKPEEFPSKFVVGDGKKYGGFLNAKLRDDADYSVVVAITSTFNEVSETAYSHVSDSSSATAVLTNEVGSKTSNGVMVTALSASIAVFACLLIVAVVLYFILRRFYRPRVRRPSEQPLAVSNPAFEGNGANFDNVYMDVLNVSVTHDFDYLSKNVWQIPPSSLEIYKPIVGYGRFGKLQNGQLTKKSSRLNVIVLTTQAPMMMTVEERRSLTYELDMMHRTSKHNNVVSLMGTSELDGSLHVVMEHERESLLSALHNSRCTDFNPGYSNAKNTTSFSSNQLLQIIMDVTKGLQYLHQNKVIHKHVMSRNILFVDNAPKLSNYGLSHFEQDNVKINNSRWLAAESIQSKRFTFKSDIWSLAVVFWEISTIGGTPYYGTSCKEVVRKILQGTRLPQPSNSSYDLFQLMLDCWQTDPDERPSVDFILQTISILIQDSRDHINVKYYSGFQYHKYDPNCD